MPADAYPVWLPLWWLLGCALVCALAFVIRPRLTWPTAFALALIARAVPMIVGRQPEAAIMHFDIGQLRIFGDILRSGHDVYTGATRYPYLPFHLYIVAAAGWVADHTAMPFEVAVKIVPVFADAAIAALLAYWPGRRPVAAAAIYTFNPLSIAVVAVHGQFDSIPGLLLLLSLLVVANGGRAAWAGFLFALSVLDKPWPIIVAPLLFWHLRRGRERTMFATAALGTVLVAVVIYALVVGAVPTALLGSVAGYGGVVGHWGLSLFAQTICGTPLCSLPMWSPFWRTTAVAFAKLAFGACLLTANVLARRAPLLRACSFVFLTFYVFTYGWGVHYLMWILPLLLLTESNRLTALYLAVAAAAYFTVLYALGGIVFGVMYLPAESALRRYVWIPSVGAWLVCAGLLVRSGSRLSRSSNR